MLYSPRMFNCRQKANGEQRNHSVNKETPHQQALFDSKM